MLGKATGIFITSLFVLIVCNAVMSLGGLLPSGLFSLDGLIGLLLALLPIIILISISGEFHVLGTGGSTGGMGSETVRILFVLGILSAVLFKIDLPSPLPNIGLGLGSDLIAMFPMYELGGLPFVLITAVVMCAFIGGVIIAVEGS
jgi:hypothetical protein